jgi:hypothetical protein
MGLFEPKTAKNQGITRDSLLCERGSVLLWILIAVALFGALSFMLNKGNRAGIGQVSQEKATLAATEILDYGQALRRVVQELQINGCEDDEISFENTTVSAYINAKAPTDESCHVFAYNGGGLNYTNADDTWFDDTYNTAPYNDGINYGRHIFSGNLPIEGIGTTAADLRYVLNFVRPEVCMAINDKLGVDNPGGAPPVDGVGTATTSYIFAGNYGAPIADVIGDDGGHDLAGKPIFCRVGSAGGATQLTYILIAR